MSYTQYVNLTLKALLKRFKTLSLVYNTLTPKLKDNRFTRYKK